MASGTFAQPGGISDPALITYVLLLHLLLFLSFGAIIHQYDFNLLGCLGPQHLARKRSALAFIRRVSPLLEDSIPFELGDSEKAPSVNEEGPPETRRLSALSQALSS